jgi:hypothetical protein
MTSDNRRHYLWIACEYPERPADGNMLYHLIFDRPCVACQMKAEAELRRIGPDES